MREEMVTSGAGMAFGRSSIRTGSIGKLYQHGASRLSARYARLRQASLVSTLRLTPSLSARFGPSGLAFSCQLLPLRAFPGALCSAARMACGAAASDDLLTSLL